MNLFDYILENLDSYFENGTVEKWRTRYKSALKNIGHDEPWLTLVSMFMLFDDQKNIKTNNINAFEKIIENSGIQTNSLKVKSIKKISLELILKEIVGYKDYMYHLVEEESFHLYPDRNEILLDRKVNKTKSIEGKTNLDLQIQFENDSGISYLFIESKFLSDIDTKTEYNPVRNQIVRNIDAMIDFALKEHIGLENMYFCLLTPGIFRTKMYGQNKKSVLDVFDMEKARFFSYVMNDYKNPENLEKALPHRNFNKKEWNSISKRIGWVTFEDIYSYSFMYNVICDSYKDDYLKFFSERNLLPKT